MQQLLRITEQGQSLYQIVVSFLLFIHPPLTRGTNTFIVVVSVIGL